MLSKSIVPRLKSSVVEEVEDGERDEGVGPTLVKPVDEGKAGPG